MQLKSMFVAGVITLLAACAQKAPTAATAAAPKGPPVVATRDGEVSGVEQNGAYAYLGIPFAAPPVGDRRWKAPAPPETWQGVREGSKSSAACYQEPPATFGPFTPEFIISLPMSEDCLYLNVWTPARHAEPLPVMVWIHGGGYGSGSNAIPIYNGSRLAARGAVVIAINYRLGAFGFLAHPEMTAESADKTSGNYGLLDMVAALQWVKDNAARFGGDPARVTIMGQSAGAGAVNSLRHAPAAKGLFSAAIAQSGSGGSFLGGRALTLEEAEAQGVAFGKKVGAKTLAQMRQVSPENVVNASRNPPPPMGAAATSRPTTPAPAPLRLSPFVDGKVLLASDAASPIPSNVPLLTGWTIDEVALSGLNMRGIDYKASPAEFEKLVRDRFGALARRALALYPHANEAEATASSLQVALDYATANTALWAEERANMHQQKTWLYVFDHPYPAVEPRKWGAFHTAEVPYLFGVLDTPGRTFTADDARVAEQIQGYWLNFARSGDPNPPGQATWPAIGSESYQWMQIGDRPGLHMAATNKERLAFFRDARAAR